MDVVKIQNNFEDDRGVIRDILTKEELDSVTLITSKKGSSRANHYHKKTVQWTYLLSGRVKYISKINDVVSDVVMEVGDLVKSDVFEAHAFYALEDSELLILTRGPRSGEDYESDTYRLDIPLEA